MGGVDGRCEQDWARVGLVRHPDVPDGCRAGDYLPGVASFRSAQGRTAPRRVFVKILKEPHTRGQEEPHPSPAPPHGHC